jgi:hypothetical protein
MKARARHVPLLGSSTPDLLDSSQLEVRRGDRLTSQALPAASLLVDDMLGAIGPEG